MVSNLYATLKELKINVRLVDGRLDLQAPKGVLNEALLAEIRHHKEELIDLIYTYRNKKEGYSIIRKVDPQDSYPVTSTQRGLWMLSQFDEANVAYNIPGVYVFEGRLNKTALEYAFNTLIERHESLRTVFREKDEEIRQYILSPGQIGFSIQYHEVEDQDLQPLIDEQIALPFNFITGPLLRAALYQTGDKKWIFVYVMHHIISDGWSMGVLINELLQLYNAHLKGDTNPLSPLRIQYKDYVAWQQEQLSMPHKAYWLQHFAGELPVLDLPVAKVRPAIQTFNGQSVHKVLNAELTAGIKTICKEQGCTLFMGLLAAVNVLLYRYTSQEDIIIGTPTAGREHDELEDQIGFYVNTLALRFQFQGNESYRQLLERVKAVTLGAYEHQVYPFGELVEALHLQRDMSRNPLFDIQVILGQEDVKRKQQNLSDLEIYPYEATGFQTSRFDMIFDFVEMGQELHLGLEYNCDIYEKEKMTQLVLHLEQLVTSIIVHPAAPIQRLNYLSADEQKRLLTDFNGDALAYSREQTVLDLFQAQVAAVPDQVALVFGNTRLTYRELDHQSSRLANYLLENYHVQPDDLVGIMVDRSEKMIIGIFGILKAGAAYVPIDPDYPAARNRFVIKDTGISVLLTQTDYMFDLDDYAGAIFAMDVQLDDLDSSISSPVIHLEPANLAYVIYTSGSTGNPKGVLIEHGNLMHSLVARLATYGHVPAFLLLSSFAFDSSIAGIFGTLCAGGKLCVVRKADVSDVRVIADYIIETQISHLLTVPSYYKLLISELEGRKNYLQQVIVAGETCTTQLVNYHHRTLSLQHCDLFNEYGPTEGSVWCSVYKYDRTKETILTIGKPIHNTQLYILNNAHELVATGIAGEICVGGNGVARGYLRQPELTEEKFVQNPFLKGTRMYKTGDLGKWLPDGNIVFIGRKDDQVKVRGYRVELGEIENVLQTHPAVSAAVVVALPDKDGNNELAAYVISNETLTSSALRSYLGVHLPVHAIPSHFVQLETFPLTPNGKVDRKQLPEPKGAGMSTGIGYVPPNNETEAELIRIWEEILGKEGIGINNSFFELGGDSIRILRMISDARKKLDLEIPIGEVYKNNTIEGIVQYCLNNKLEISQENRRLKEIEETVIAEITSLKERVLTGMDAVERDNIADVYTMSDIEKGMVYASLLNEGSAVYHDQMIHQRTFVNFDIERFNKAFNLVIEKHDILRTCFDINSYDTPVQLVYKKVDVTVHYEDLASLPVKEQEQYVRDFVAAELKVPFVLTKAPLCRMAAFNLGADRILFVSQCHHSIIDGWSDAIYMTELNNVYLELVKDSNYKPEKLKAGYKDFIIQHEIDKRNTTIRNFWNDELASARRLDLFTAEETDGEYSHQLDPQLIKKLETTAVEINATSRAITLAAFTYMLHLLTDEQDVIVGLVTNTRPVCEDSDKILGCFLNTIPFKVETGEQIKCVDLVRSVQQKLVTLKEYERLSLLEIAQIHQWQPEAGNPFFDVIFNYVDFHAYNAIKEEMPAEEIAGEIPELRVNGNADTNTYLDFNIDRTGGKFLISFSVNKELKAGFSPEKTGMLYLRILQYIISTPYKAIRELAEVTGEERQLVLETFNDTTATYPDDQTLISLFEAQVASTSDKTALTFRGIHFSYNELNERANQLGDYLRRNYNIQSDDIIAIKLERSEWMIISLLGILKAGAAYLPIDPDYPESRVAYMLENSQCKVLIDEVFLTAFSVVSKTYTTDNLQGGSKPTDLAYVIYTSGSTGNPKGCMLEHRGVINRIVWMWTHYGFSDKDIILQKTTYTFDVSVWELFMPLCMGSRMVLCEKDDIAVPARIASLISEEQVTCLHFVPGVLNVFIASLFEEEGICERLSSLRLVVASGEALSPGTVKNWYDKVQVPLHNLYGPTEASVDVTYYATSAQDHKIPIGKPIWNMEVLILDKDNHLLPVGLVGEISLGGIGLSRGYLRNPVLTAEKFVAHPFKPGKRIYKTGDLGRWLPDGNVEYLGRKDDQVKIRGYRIETGEIEAALHIQPGVDSAVVIARADKGGEKELIAYVAGKSSVRITDLREGLSKVLPGYMLPAHFVILDTLPLTPNGKIDRKRLPTPDTNGEEEYIAPRTVTEEKLAAIWQELLGKDRISIRDNFFHLGGHSLKATRLASQIHKLFNVKVSLKELFSAVILEDQARLIAGADEMLFSGIMPVVPQPHYALSSSQRRLWVLSQFPESSVAYNMPGVYVLEGSLDRTSLAAAFSALVARHESLRTVFMEDEHGDIRQFIQVADDFELAYEDFRDIPDQEEVVKQIVNASMQQPFDLSRGPLLRASLLRVSDNRWVLCYTMHHIISDGWSMGILLQELSHFYNSLRLGATATLPALRIQYKDYAAWQQAQVLGSHKTYWLSQFEGELPVLELATDRPRPAIKTYNGGSVNKVLDSTVSKALESLVQAHGSTLFMGLLAAVNTLLYRYTQQDDIIIGSPIAGRNHADLEGQIGFYVNTLALRSRFRGSDSYISLLDHVRSVTLGAYDHQVYPFDELVDSLPLERDLSRNSLFDVMLVLQDLAVDNKSGQQLEGIKISNYNSGDHPVSKFDLVFNFATSGDILELGIVYNSDLFDRSTITRMSDHLERLLKVITAQPSLPLQQLNYLSTAEQEQLLNTFNNTAVEYPRDHTLISLFEAQVNNTPGKPALTFNDRHFTYRELNERSNQLGDYLRQQHKIQPGDLIGILLDRSEWLLITILGILKAGGAYVPIDPEYPQQRIDDMIIDSGCKLLITAKTLAAFMVVHDDYTKENLSPVNSPDDLVYIMYTSGSTGKPKGVMVENRGVVRLVKSATYAELSEDRILLSTGAVSFDATTFEYWGMLLNGGHLVLCEREVLLNVAQLEQEVIKEKVDTMWFTAGWLHQLIDTHISLFSNIKTVLSGGDKLSAAHINKLRQHYPMLKIINAYGPTENTAFSLTYEVKVSLPDIPIGKPISNSTVYILDHQQQLLPVGVSGEIYVGGDGLSRGYLHNPALTAEKFIPHPFKPGERIYKTGDQGRWLPDGNILFMGRKDDQVKIRGYRIETGEVEVALQALQGVDAGVVTVHVNSTGEKELVAYAVMKSSIDLREGLSKVLPGYMLPAHFVILDTLPLAPNGKIDRKRLPAPDTNSEAEYVAPRTATEKKLAAIWQELLGKDHISIRDDFFHLGGHSLKATRLASQIHKIFNVKVSLKELFTAVILEDQARLIAGADEMLFTGITPVVPQPHYVLSSSQRRLWVLSQFPESSVAYNMPGVYVLEGSLDRTSLAAAFSALVARHESLRTVFMEDEQGDIRQFIQVADDFELAYEDFRDIPDQEEVVKQIVNASMQQPFDLSRGPLLRASLLRVSDNRWVLCYTMHHIISDGWSMGILLQELSHFYNSLRLGATATLPALRIQYKDYAAWQQAQVLGSHKTYWLSQFEGELPVLELATDRPRPAIKTYNGGSVNKVLDSTVSKALESLVQAHGSTLFMGLLAAVNTLLYRYTQQDDIIIGSPIAGRNHADLEGQIGFYVNTLALRSRFRGSDSYISLLDHVRSVTLGAYDHQVYPFDELVDFLPLERDLSRNSLFDVMVLLQNTGMEGALLGQLEGIKISNYDNGDNPVSKFDLSFNFATSGDILELGIMYNSDLFDRSTITRMSDHLEQLLKVITAQPSLSLDELDYLSVAEKEQLLHTFNNTTAVYQEDQTLIALFEEQVVRQPEKAAVVFEGRTISYRHLNSLANQLGDYFRKQHGIQPEDKVVIMLERSEWLLVAILGVLKAGAAYVPVDPEYPADRIDYILADSQSKIVFDKVMLDAFIRDRVFYDEHNLQSVNKPADLAYIIYTSGSTGKPKGVMIEQQALINYLFAISSEYNFEADEKVLQVANVAFDASAEQIFLAILSGATLYMVKQYLSIAEGLDNFITANGITHLHAVPSLLLQLDLTKENALKRVVSAGENFPAVLRENIRKQVDCYNKYGPTEATISATIYKVTGMPMPGAPIPIGHPIGNTQVYITNAQGALVPIGITGEICISGAGLARGYVNHHSLTAEKFISHPFKPGERLYKTGDQGRWLPDGNIVFVGRKDEQVKIRGYRIETGEVEAALQALPDVNTAVVTVHLNSTGEKELVAYVVAKSPIALKEALSKVLPGYMIPAHFVLLDELPLTANGKTDKKRLPAPGSNSGNEYTAPRNNEEKMLVQIWEEVLGKQSIGIRDNFFEVGGHSLKAMRLLRRLNKESGMQLKIQDLYNHPTIEGLVNISHESGRTIRLGNEHDTAKQNLYFIPPILGNAILYKPLADRLKNKFNCYGLQYGGLVKGESLYTSLEQAAEEFSKEIMLKPATNKHVVITGYSMGASIAFETTRILETAGWSVTLILLDRGVHTQGEGGAKGIDVSKRVTWLVNKYSHLIGDAGIDVAALKRFLFNNIRISDHYRPAGHIKSKMYVFESTGNKTATVMHDWQAYTSGGLEHYYIKGDHWAVLDQSNLTYLESVISGIRHVYPH